MKRYLMALDQGTTSSRCIIFDACGSPVAGAAREFTQYFPREGLVEHDAVEIWESQLLVAREALRKAELEACDIAAIGITNQRETFLVWEKATGKPISHAIVWQCRRSADLCDQLRERGLGDTIRAKTGLTVDPYFSATKLSMLLSEHEGARERAARGELLFGTVDTWLIWNLTGGRVHATDPSNAARTMLFNIHTLTWDEDLLKLFEIPAAMLPQILPSSGQFGLTDSHLLGAPIAICGVAGDQQAALFGQCCFEKGAVKNTYGTGGFLLMNTGEQAVSSQNGLLTTIGWQIGGRTTYVLEGSVFICGAAIQWLRDGLGLLASAAESAAIASTVPDTAGVYFVPAFVGLGTPYWNAWARGTIVGITRGTTRAHLVRATLEAMAFQTTDVLDAMRRDTGLSIPALQVDGGATQNDLLLSIQSDLLGAPILRPACVETTAQGAANLAGLGCGLFRDLDEIRALRRTDRTFTPSIGSEERQARLAAWHRAVRCALAFAEQH